MKEKTFKTVHDFLFYLFLTFGKIIVGKDEAMSLGYYIDDLKYETLIGLPTANCENPGVLRPGWR